MNEMYFALENQLYFAAMTGVVECIDCGEPMEIDCATCGTCGAENSVYM